MMKTTIAYLELLPRWIGYASCLLVIPLILTTCYEVVARYLFGAPTIWSFEIGYMLTGAFFLLGSGLALQRGSHIRVDLFYHRLSLRKRNWLDLLFYALVVLPLVTWTTFALAGYFWSGLESGETTGASAWNPPVWPLRLIFVVGFATLILQLAAECLKRVDALFGQPEKP